VKAKPITPKELLRELREMALLEAKATDDASARLVWLDVFNWAEVTAERNRINISDFAACQETANDRSSAAGSTRKGDRRMTDGKTTFHGMATPDKPGQWRVRHKNGTWHNAEVRETGCGLEAKIVGCGDRWHSVEWISMNSWKEWDTVPASSLFIPLRREWFEAFVKGHKTFEYRPYGPRWNERTCAIGRRVTLSLGYGKRHRLHGTIVSFERSEDVTRTTAWQSCYGGKGYTAAAKIGVRLDADTTFTGLAARPAIMTAGDLQRVAPRDSDTTDR
jgi:hypothetical protein